MKNEVMEKPINLFKYTFPVEFNTKTNNFTIYLKDMRINGITVDLIKGVPTVTIPEFIKFNAPSKLFDKVNRSILFVWRTNYQIKKLIEQNKMYQIKEDEEGITIRVRNYM